MDTFLRSKMKHKGIHTHWKRFGSWTLTHDTDMETHLYMWAFLKGTEKHTHSYDVMNNNNTQDVFDDMLLLHFQTEKSGEIPLINSIPVTNENIADWLECVVHKTEMELCDPVKPKKSHQSKKKNQKTKKNKIPPIGDDMDVVSHPTEDNTTEDNTTQNESDGDGDDYDDDNDNDDDDDDDDADIDGDADDADIDGDADDADDADAADADDVDADDDDVSDDNDTAEIDNADDNCSEKSENDDGTALLVDDEEDDEDDNDVSDVDDKMSDYDDDSSIASDNIYDDNVLNFEPYTYDTSSLKRPRETLLHLWTS